MFNFMKKATEKDDKEKRKREKKERKDVKKRDRSSMSAEELLRLDEVRRSLKIPGRRKEKQKLPSGITADYSASFFAYLDRDLLENSQNSANSGQGMRSGNNLSNKTQDSLMQSDSSEISLTSLTIATTTSTVTLTDVTDCTGKNLPPLPPKPPKRGILKGSRLNISGTANTFSEENALSNGDEVNYQEASNLLVRNTLQNEVIAYQNVPTHLSGFGNAVNIEESCRGQEMQTGPSLWQISPHRSVQQNQQQQQQYHHHYHTVHHQGDTKLLQVVTSASPSADSLTDTTNSSFATPPFSLSPVGESQGFSRWRSSASFEEQGVELQLPEIVPIELPEPRELTIHRQPPPRSDFGFSLRRAVIVKRSTGGVAQMKSVIFAEPGSLVQNNNDTGLLPGDRLIEVNGIDVDDKSREEIIDFIKRSGNSVTVRVQPVAELSELSRRSATDGQAELAVSNSHSSTLCHRGNLRFHDNVARSEEHLAQEQEWLNYETIWLLHRGGFTLATKYNSADPDTGKLKIRLIASGEELLVDEEDIEKANPPQFDKVEDLTRLRFLNESSVLHTLRQRYASNLIHTYAGDSMIIINPVVPLAIYSEKVALMFRGYKTEDMPPHIYAMAQAAYKGMLATRRDHSLVFLGRSGSGKTTNFKHVLHYLVLAAGTVNKILTIEKLNAVFTVLEAFGNCRTQMNSNATRFTQLFSLDFDQSGQIASASLQVLLLEKSRIGKGTNGDPTFHAIYRLLAGAEGVLRKELHLTNLVAENNPFITPLQKHEDKQRAMVEFNRIVAAFRILGISETDEKVIWLVLTSIYHLSCAGAVKIGTSSQSRWQFGRVECAEKAATLLGTTVEELSRIVFSSNGGGAGTPNTPRPALRTPSPTEQSKDFAGLDALEGLLIGLYSETFHCIAALINRSISSSVHTVATLLLCDSPGFQNPATCGRQTGACFEDLCHNYLHERLQLLFHHTTLVAPKDRYVQEGIDVDYEDDCDELGIGSPQALISLLDRGSSQGATMLRTSQNDLTGSRQIERKGLLWLLDEETVCPGGSDETFLDRLFSHYGDRDYQMLLRKAPGNNQFILQHLLGTNPVLYTATGWLKATREHPVTKSAITILQESIREDVRKLFISARGAGVSGTLCSSMSGLEGSQSLRRASSIRRTFTAVKRKNVCLQVKFTVDGLVETLRRTRVKFIHCILPQHNSGCTDNKSLLSVKSNQSEDNVINVPLLRSQIRGSQIIDAVRLHKVGFPKHMALGEFRRRFGLLSTDFNARPSSPIADERRAVEDMLLTVDIDPATYRVGQSQIFFRSGTLERFEAQRDEKLTGHIILLQARCRGYLARRKLNTLKLQDLAVRCIQRNIKKWMSVREWAWWRLYIKVAPLLNVHRTEDQLKAKTEELEILRAKVERLEQERNHLKRDNDILEAKERKTARMPSVPVMYTNATTSSSNDTLQSFEESLSRSPLDDKGGSSSEAMIDYSSRPIETRNLMKRPPLPPCIIKRPASRGYAMGSSLIRSPSPCSLSSSLSHRSKSLSIVSARPHTRQDFSSNFSIPPRRMYPLENSLPSNVTLDVSKEQAPVVFDASLNFVLGCEKQRVRQHFRPTASYLEPTTASSDLSLKISQFLKKTDHIMDEWRSLGHKDDMDNDLSLQSMRPTNNRYKNVMGRSQSATNIMIRGFQYYSRSNSVAKSCCSRSSLSRASEDRTMSDSVDQELSEISADFAEEHSTSTLAAERINAETSERLRLERELQDVTVAHKNLQQATERLEMELLYARAADLNGVASDVEEGEDGGVYKQRYEHAVRELEFTKRKMTQQHEDDLEQLVGLKKQLEKKLADAYEEVEEQRQVVGQWKRRVQKLNGEMHDLRLLLEEQTTRNNLLEKKQRKFDSETQNLLNDLRQEKAQRERVAREKEIAIAEKFTIEQNLSDARLEIELKEERLRTLSQELEELTFGGKTEEEVAHLKKAKHELEKRVKDQEEELDDLAGQVQLLEQAKLRLEMSIEQQRKEMRKEMQLRDEELEDVRGSALKKVKALESQLENEHEERTILLREKHELERRLVTIEEQDRAERAIEAETMHRLKRDLKRTKALLRDAQTMLERSKGESTGKAALRQLKNQLEDAECARAVAIKAKQALELELNEIQASLDEALRQRSEVEERASIANRERTELLSQLEENEEELAEVLKKYRAAVQQVSAEQGQLQEAQIQITALETEKSSLKDQLLELTQRLESVEQLGDPTANSLVTRRLEFRTKELESKLELEQTTRARLETQIARLKENVEKLQIESALLRTKEQTAQDAARRLQKSLREAREEVNSAVAREQEATRAHRELEKSLEAAEAETKIARDDLRLALQRIDDLQSAIQGELDLDCSEEATTENSDSD